MHCGHTGEIIAASDFEEQEVRDVIMGKSLIAFGVQQYDFFATDSLSVDRFSLVFWEV